MKAQRITRQGDKKPFAIRLFEPPTVEPIKPDGKIVPLPELGGIGHNFERYDGLIVLWWKLKKPEHQHGIKATLRAEVWNTLKGERRRLAEIWFATHTPPEHKTLADFITGFLESNCRRLQAESFKCNPPLIVEKQIGAPVDIRGKTKQVLSELLQREYPQFFKAYQTKQPAGVQHKAYVADLWALLGRAPDAQGLENLAHDTGFTRWLSAAFAKSGRKVETWEWEIAVGWIQAGLHSLDDDALAKDMNQRTGLALKPSAWRKRAQRMGLVSSRKIGAPEKHILTFR